jgi:uncharacterized protein YecT (DUF1311 family)
MFGLVFRGRAVVFGCALVAMAGLAYADEEGEADQACNGTTSQIVDCMSAQGAQWDKRLAIAYEQALQVAVSQAQSDQLRVAQQLWLQFRAANCRYYVLGEGTIAPVEAADCFRRLTETRAREFEDMMH